jgi:uncharacterized membrane protein
MKRPRWRKMTWVLILWCVGIIFLAVVTDIQYHEHISRKCIRGCRSLLSQLGASSVAATLIVGVLGLVVLGVLWLVTLRDDPPSPSLPTDTP